MKAWLKGGIFFLFLFLITRIILVADYLLTPGSKQLSETFRLFFSLSPDILEMILSNLIPLISFFIFGAILFYILYSKKIRYWLKGGIIFTGTVQFILAFNLYYSLEKLLNILNICFDYLNGLLWYPYDFTGKRKIILVLIYFVLLFLAGSIIGITIRKYRK